MSYSCRFTYRSSAARITLDRLSPRRSATASARSHRSSATRTFRRVVRVAPGGGGVKVSGADAAKALGIDWTTYQPVLSQAVPPSYTEHIGAQLLDHLRQVAA